MLTNENTLPFAAWNQSFSELKLSYSPEQNVLFNNMSPQGLPSFTPELLKDIHQFHNNLTTFLANSQQRIGSPGIQYLVNTSTVPGIFNLGGDLGRFARLIRAQDRELLSQYAKACIDVLYANFSSFQSEITTICLLEGTAAGGGFEAALSNDIIIAERGTEMGFPEVIFNLFPGMGAYSFLSRRLTPAHAERIINSGRMYSAEEMHEMGIVNELADPGEGRIVLQRFIKKHAKYSNTHRAMKRVKTYANPITEKELLDIASIWVEAALQLPEANLKTMERLVKAQTHRMQKNQNNKHTHAHAG